MLFIILLSKKIFPFVIDFLQIASIQSLQQYNQMSFAQSNKQFFEQDPNFGRLPHYMQDPEYSSILESQGILGFDRREQDNFQKQDNTLVNTNVNIIENMSMTYLLSQTDQFSEKIQEQKPIKRTYKQQKPSFKAKNKKFSLGLIHFIAKNQPIFGLSRRYYRSKKIQEGVASELQAISNEMNLHPSCKKANRDATKRFDQQLNDIFIQSFSKGQAMDKTQSALLCLIQNMNDDEDCRTALGFYIQKYNQRRHQSGFLDRLIKREKLNKMFQKSS